ncbi:hypothetical protein [Arthrobacter tecti]
MSALHSLQALPAVHSNPGKSTHLPGTSGHLGRTLRRAVRLGRTLRGAVRIVMKRTTSNPGLSLALTGRAVQE